LRQHVLLCSDLSAPILLWRAGPREYFWSPVLLRLPPFFAHLLRVDRATSVVGTLGATTATSLVGSPRRKARDDLPPPRRRALRLWSVTFVARGGVARSVDAPRRASGFWRSPCWIGHPWRRRAGRARPPCIGSDRLVRLTDVTAGLGFRTVRRPVGAGATSTGFLSRRSFAHTNPHALRNSSAVYGHGPPRWGGGLCWCGGCVCVVVFCLLCLFGFVVGVIWGFWFVCCVLLLATTSVSHDVIYFFRRLALYLLLCSCLLRSL